MKFYTDHPFFPLILVVLIALVFVPANPVSAQNAPLTLFVERAETQDFPQIRLFLTALEINGKPLGGLVKEQFTIQEDGGEALKPDRLDVLPQAPLQVMLVLDASASMSGAPLQEVKNAASRFLDRLNEQDQVALIALGGEISPQLDQLQAGREIDFGASLKTCYEGIENLQAEGQTLLYHGLAKAIQLIARQPAGHRVVILISDGRNEPPQQGEAEEPLRLAQQAHVPIYVIGYGRQLDLAYLQRLAYESGGLFWAAPSDADLSLLYGDIAQALRSQLMLTYTSRLEADGKPHTVLITLQTAKGAVQTKLQVELPALPTTPALTVTPTLPPLIPTETNLPLLTQPTPPAAANPLAPYLVYLLAGGGFLLLAVLAFFLRRKPATEWVCARCGFALKDSDLTCPQCGETRKLPLRKG